MYLPFISLILAAYLIFLLAGIVREDNSSGKIRNKELVSGLKAVLLAVLAFLAVTVAVLEWGLAGDFWRPYFGYGYYFALFQNAAIGLMAGIVLWKAGVWPAGDAKLYFLVCSALPLVISYAGWSPYFLFLSLLLNIFVPAAALYFAHMTRDYLELAFEKGRTSLAEKIRTPALAAAAGLREKPGKALFFMFVMLLFSLARAWNSSVEGVLHINESLLFILLMLAGRKSGEYAEKAGVRVMLLCFAAAAAAIAMSSFHLPRLSGVIVYGFFKSLQFMIFRWVLYSVADRHLVLCGTSRVSLDKITPGMIISGEYLEQLEKAAPEFFERCGFDKYRDGLTAGQVEELRSFLGDKKADSGDDVAIPMFCVKPFAFWISLGAAMTAALSGKHVLMYAQEALSLAWRAL